MTSPANSPPPTETFDPPLDPGIAPYVAALRTAGVETYESCQGGERHAFPVPTVRFHGNGAAGLRALSAALDAGLPVSGLRRVWDVVQREATGPTWEMVFSPATDKHLTLREIRGLCDQIMWPKNSSGFALTNEALLSKSVDEVRAIAEEANARRKHEAEAVNAAAAALPPRPETVPVGEVFDRKGVGLYLADVVGLAKLGIAFVGGGEQAAGERVLTAVRAWEARRSPAEAPPDAKEPPIGRDPSVAVVLAEPIGEKRAFIIGMFHLGTHFIDPDRGMRKMEGHRFDVVLMEHGASTALVQEALRRLRKGGFACEVFFDERMGVGVAKRSATVALAQAEREIASLTPSGKAVPREKPIAFSVQHVGEAIVVPKLEPGEVHDPYTAIRVERVHQDRKHGGPEHDDGCLTGEFVQLIRAYCEKADEELRLVPRAGERGRGLRHRLVQIAALAVAAVESLDRVLGTKVVHPRNRVADRDVLLDEIDIAFSSLDGGEEGFIPKPQKLPERIRSFAKAVREAVGSDHPGVGWTLLDRFKGEGPAVGSTSSLGGIPVRMPEQLRLQIRQAWDRARKSASELGTTYAAHEADGRVSKPFFAFWGDVSDLGLNVRSWASARTDADLPKDISTRAKGEDGRAVRIDRPKDSEPAAEETTSTRPVVVLLAEPLLGAREYIRGFFDSRAHIVEPGSTVIPLSIDVLVVERGARDVDIARLKDRLVPGGVVLPVDFARGTMTVTPSEPKAPAPAKDAAPTFKTPGQARYTSWTVKADTLVHGHPVHAGDLVQVANRRGEVFVRFSNVEKGLAGYGEWLAPVELPRRVQEQVNADLASVGMAFVQVISSEEMVFVRHAPDAVRLVDNAHWKLASGLSPRIYFVFSNSFTDTIAEAVTIATE